MTYSRHRAGATRWLLSDEQGIGAVAVDDGPPQGGTTGVSA